MVMMESMAHGASLHDRRHLNCVFYFELFLALFVDRFHQLIILLCDHLLLCFNGRRKAADITENIGIDRDRLRAQRIAVNIAEIHTHGIMDQIKNLRGCGIVGILGFQRNLKVRGHNGIVIGSTQCLKYCPRHGR